MKSGLLMELLLLSSVSCSLTSASVDLISSALVSVNDETLSLSSSLVISLLMVGSCDLKVGGSRFLVTDVRLHNILLMAPVARLISS